MEISIENEPFVLFNTHGKEIALENNSPRPQFVSQRRKYKSGEAAKKSAPAF